ncbi:hypothetical protein DYB34_011708 [Aphanomyces astaci]|uniref:Acyltransferase 3 domain-containing protein n=1 Tax=Aphanomyces astaci TaxID=112090 RepID=A0A418BJ51_APHAT|nr:hypothetical protein DYB34_011708 [Aphanomyces astaci]
MNCGGFGTVSTTADTSNGVDTAEFAVLAEEATPPEPKYPIKYWPDIYGLRTLAVVPVVLLHAYPLSINGGFTRVDVFFVIAGYLISCILFKENAKGSLTYADFYSRRIHRIFAALLLVFTFTLVVGCVWLLDKAVYLGRRSATTTQCVWRYEGDKFADVSAGHSALLEETNPNPLIGWSLVPPAAAEVPLPGTSPAAAGAPGDLDMGEDEPVKVLNAPALSLQLEVDVLIGRPIMERLGFSV